MGHSAIMEIAGQPGRTYADGADVGRGVVAIECRAG